MAEAPGTSGVPPFNRQNALHRHRFSALWVSPALSGQMLRGLPYALPRLQPNLTTMSPNFLTWDNTITRLSHIAWLRCAPLRQYLNDGSSLVSVRPPCVFRRPDHGYGVFSMSDGGLLSHGHSQSSALPSTVVAIWNCPRTTVRYTMKCQTRTPVHLTYFLLSGPGSRKPKCHNNQMYSTGLVENPLLPL